MQCANAKLRLQQEAFIGNWPNPDASDFTRSENAHRCVNSPSLRGELRD